MRTWKGLLEKKSASLMRFWLFAKRETFGTSSTAVSGSTTTSFIWTWTLERSGLGELSRRT